MLQLSKKEMIYLDNAATTPLAPQVKQFIIDSIDENFANPSSIHRLGRQSKKKINQARKQIANSINAQASDITFLSSATEANNTVFNILDYDLIITSPSEHSSIIEPAKATKKPMIWLNLNKEGFINLDELENHIANNSDKKILLSLMHANSEIGTIQDLEQVGQICKKFNNVIFHSDCVQSYRKVDIDVEKFNLDFISVSSHKIHGPKGIGFLYSRKSKVAIFKRYGLIIGGGQEDNFRSGTENIQGILAFAKASELHNKDKNDKVRELRDLLLYKIKNIAGFHLNGSQEMNTRLPGNLNVSFINSKLTSEQAVLQADLNGLCLSSGSACTFNKRDNNSEAIIKTSYVLRACGIPDNIASKAIRISLSYQNTIEEINKTADILKDLFS